MIRSNTHAFEILETPQKCIPYDAIRYLYDQAPNAEIKQKVLFWLENAYNDSLEEEEGSVLSSEAAVWFAIVAENYIEEALLDPVINLYIKVDEDWDLLNEQGAVLIKKLCEQLGDVAVERFLNAIIQQIEAESKLPYLYLFECFKFVDPTKYPEQILSLFQKSNHWLEGMLEFTIDIQFSQKKHPELIAKVHQQLELLRLEIEMKETQDHIEERNLRAILSLQEFLSTADYPQTKEEYWMRGPWEAHYRRQEERLEQSPFLDDPHEIPAPISVPKKVSRNAPCPCGSGKKYKRCCL